MAISRQDTGRLLVLDQRRRAHFGRIGRHLRYLAREYPDGMIILTPIEDDTQIPITTKSTREK